MKKAISLIVFIMILFTAGCNKNKEQPKVTQQKKASLNQPKDVKKRSKLTEAQIQNKIKEGKAIVLSNNGEQTPLKMEGSKVKAVKMPDGSLWQVNEEDGKTMLRLPNGETVQEKMINGKMMLLTDEDKQYEVQVINGKMFAVMPENKTVAFEKK